MVLRAAARKLSLQTGMRRKENPGDGIKSIKLMESPIESTLMA
jgi:hypothetical protein